MNEDLEKLASWMIKQGFATGHVDTVDDLLIELDCQYHQRILYCQRILLTNAVDVIDDLLLELDRKIDKLKKKAYGE